MESKMRSSSPMEAEMKSITWRRRIQPRHWIAVGVVAVALGAAALWIGQAYFFPESATRVDEAAPESAQVVRTGTFQGADRAHHVSGTVKILEMGGAHYLRFEDYDQTQGPDVFVYLTASATPGSRAEVESGLKVLIEGGADGGESTKVGNFQQMLPAGFDPAQHMGVAIWCDQFNVLFGRASLSA